ncbi:hypothetical protein ACP4OV_023890 [Aristida adscensionis]
MTSITAQPASGSSAGAGAGSRPAGAAPCCRVCKKPPEWVAVGPCGHRELCVACAVRLRHAQRDRRCCVCRAPCPTVTVTKAGGGHRHGALSVPPANSVGRSGRVMVYYWYHGGMAAYFDHREQYEAARKMCLRSSPEVDNDERARQLAANKFGPVIVASSACIGGLLGAAFISGVHPWYYIAAIVLGFALVLGGIMYTAIYHTEVVYPLNPDE